MSETTTAALLEAVLRPEGPYYELLVLDDQHPAGRVGHVCVQCGRNVDDQPCPEHAPSEVPGLQLVHCDTHPQHRIWVLAGDYYNVPCHRCLLDQAQRRERERQDTPHLRRRHWYRRTSAWALWIRFATRIRLATGWCAQTCPGGGWCRTVYWRWSR